MKSDHWLIFHWISFIINHTYHTLKKLFSIRFTWKMTKLDLTCCVMLIAGCRDQRKTVMCGGNCQSANLMSLLFQVGWTKSPSSSLTLKHYQNFQVTQNIYKWHMIYTICYQVIVICHAIIIFSCTPSKMKLTYLLPKCSLFLWIKSCKTKYIYALTHLYIQDHYDC